MSSSNPTRERTSTLALACAAAVIIIEVLVQQWGSIVHDSRVDLALDPISFLARNWHLWVPANDMGSIQNQAVGYVFPMGPFFALAHLLHVPVWITERAWIALLLVIALWGAARLADALDIGTPMSRLVGAISYALGAFFVARVGNTSVFVLGAVFVPWVVIPLARGSQGGSVRRAACCSGLAVLAMGGVNASVALDVLVLPALFLLTRTRGPRRAALSRWWLAAVLMATAWWVIPLVYEAHYGANFLAYTEHANITTAFTSPFEVLRGTADWLSHYNNRGPVLASGYQLVSNGWLIAVGSVVVALGLFGLARRDLPERLFLVASFALGVALVGAGFGGHLGNPAAGLVTRLLDGLLSGFRSVYKFEPVVALPVALGIAHTVASITRWSRARVDGPRDDRPRVLAPVVGSTVVVGLILVAAWPLLTNQLLNNEPFTQIPSWWTQAETFISRTPGRVLLVPGLPQSDSTWGYTEQEPLQWGSHVPWATRSIAPLGGTAATRYLDAVEGAIEKGGDVALPAYLARGGFSQIVVRNDGRWQKYDAPSPRQVNDALGASGLQRVASFGPALAEPETPRANQGDLRQIDIYEVARGRALSSYPLSGAAVVSGGPETPLTLERLGLGDRAYVLAQDLAPGDPVPTQWVVTDGNQRRSVSFGTNRDNEGYVLAPDALANENQGATITADGGPEDQTVLGLSGISGISASSSGSLLEPFPDVGPGLALDGQLSTAWVAGTSHRSSEGQWIQVDLARPRALDHLDVVLLEDGPWRPAVHSLRVSTTTGSVVTPVRSDQSVQRLAVPRGATPWVRVTFESVTPSSELSAGAGIRELRVPGTTVDQRLVLSSSLVDQFRSPSSQFPIYVFERSTAPVTSVLRLDEELTIHRRFVTPRAGSMTVSATSSPIPSTALLDLLDTQPGFSVSASSTMGNRPMFAPRNLLDGDASSIWVASTTPLSSTINDEAAVATYGPTPSPGRYDPNPSVSMSWHEPRTLDRLLVKSAAGYSAPVSVHISSGDQTRTAIVPPDGITRFVPIEGVEQVTISFPRIHKFESNVGAGQTLRPLGLSELSFPALDDLAPGPIDPAQPLQLSCDQGPTLVVAGVVRHFSIDTTYGDLVSLSQVQATTCGNQPIHLAAGPHDLDSSIGVVPFTLDDVVLAAPGGVTPVGASRPMRATSWGDEARTVRIGPGASSYLVVNENFNEGWQARLEGHTLRAVKVDGWRQAWVIPAGGGGLAQLRYTPTRGYRAGLLIGAGLVMALLCLALLPDRGLISRGVGRRSGPLPSGVCSPVVAWSLALLTGVAVGGPMAVLLWPLWWLRRRRPGWMPGLAVGAFVGSGVIVMAITLGWPGTSSSALDDAHLALAVVSFLAVISSLPMPRPAGLPRSRSPRSSL
jgi:arabinofuranan 3-O-arabinosyltransferase